jgi:hypothetical protein
MNLIYNIENSSKGKIEDRITNVFVNLLEKICEINPDILSDFIDDLFPEKISKPKKGFLFDQQKYCYFSILKFKVIPDCGICWKEDSNYYYLIIEIKRGGNYFTSKKNINQLYNDLETISKNSNAYLLGISDDSEENLQDVRHNPAFSKFRDKDEKIPRFKLICWDELFVFFMNADPHRTIHFLFNEFKGYKKQLLRCKVENFRKDFGNIIQSSFIYKQNEISHEIYDTSMKDFLKDIKKEMFVILEAQELPIQIGNNNLELNSFTDSNCPLKYFLKIKDLENLKDINFYIQFRKQKDGYESFLFIAEINIGGFNCFNRIIIGELLGQFILAYYDGANEGIPFTDKNRNFTIIEFIEDLFEKVDRLWGERNWVTQLREKSASMLVSRIKEFKEISVKYINLLDDTIKEFELDFSGSYKRVSNYGHYINKHQIFGLLFYNNETTLTIFFGLRVNYDESFYPKLDFFIEIDPKIKNSKKEEIMNNFNQLDTTIQQSFELVKEMSQDDWRFIKRERILTDYNFLSEEKGNIKNWFDECMELVKKLGLTN